jgi:hypothetical protein
MRFILDTETKDIIDTNPALTLCPCGIIKTLCWRCTPQYIQNNTKEQRKEQEKTSHL